MKTWEFLDQFSIKPTIFVNGKLRYTTAIGLILSILTSISVMVMAGFFINSFVEKRDVSVISYTEYKQDAIYMDLNLKPFMFKFYEYDSVEFKEKEIDPSIASVDVIYLHLFPEDAKITSLEYEQCEFDRHLPNPIYKNELLKDRIDNFQCIKPGKYNVSLSKTPFIEERSYINIYVAECKNSTENNNSCKPREEIQSFLRKTNMYFEWIMPTANIDHSDVKNPVKENIISQGELPVFYDFKYSHANIFKKFIYASDNGIVFEDFKITESYNYDKSASRIEVLPPTTEFMVSDSFFIVQFFAIESELERYKRTYPKFQSVLASIGGVMKLFVTVAQIFTNFLTYQMMVVDITNSFVHFKKADTRNVVPFRKRNSTTYNFWSNTNKNSSLNLNQNYIEPEIKGPSEKFDTNGNSYSKTVENKKQNLAQNRNIKLSCFEALCPRNCSAKNSAKRILDKCEKIYSKKMSVEYILKKFAELDRFKKVIFSEKEMIILDMIKFDTLEETLKKLEVKNFSKQIDKIFQDLSDEIEKDSITNRLIKAYSNYKI